jgi:exoribonuclease R
VDRRLPKIRVVTRQAPSIADQRIVVVIDDWPRDSLYPVGHYVKSLGPIGDADAETAAVLLEADVDDRPFAPAVHACVPPLPWRFEESEHLGPIPKLRREDHRALRVCSVDPPGCRDIDDALSCRVIETLDGDSNAPKTFELGVHIADVTSFLKPNTAMDDEARRRGTTTYLVNKRLDMLPKPLTEDICSLRGGTERLTFSVFFKFDATTGLPVPDAQPRFTKAVIKSDAALTYQEAQTMMDDPDDKSDLAKDLRNINFCAKALRARRVAAGALSLASPEVKFELDKTTSDPLDVGMYVTREANRMVEEMMLLANVASAEAILKAFPSQAMLRRHPAPAPRMFDPLLKSCAAAGVNMDVTSSKSPRGFAGRRHATRRRVLQHAAAHRRHAMHEPGGVLRLRRGERARAERLGSERRDFFVSLRPRRASVHALHVPDPPVRGRRRSPSAQRRAGPRAPGRLVRERRRAERNRRQRKRSPPQLAGRRARVGGTAHAHFFQEETGGAVRGARRARQGERRGGFRSQVWHRGAFSV